MKLIIPSATLLPIELQNIGKLPAVIYPINQRIVFDYLYDQYHLICDSIEIICFEEIDKVESRLMRYINKNVAIKTIPTLSDLGHTIYYALEGITDEVIINFSDTIVMDEIYGQDENKIFYFEDYLSETWTYFEEQDGKITEIYDKIPLTGVDKKKLFIGVFQITDPLFFRKCLSEAFLISNREMSTFYYALFIYSQKYPFSYIKTENWFDIGHADTYYNSKLEVRAREFNHITIDKNRGILHKTSDDKEKFVEEIKWYLKLPSDIEYVRPRIFSYSTDYSNPYISMEYYAYHTVHELFLYGDLNYHQWINIFYRIYFVFNDFKRYKVSDSNIKSSLEDMYLIKTLQRFDKMKTNGKFLTFFNNTITVNDVKYKSLDEISLILSKEIPKVLYDVNSFNIIHGDLCFTNIMIDNNFSFIKVVDPRGKFGMYDIYGDSRYELAKLFHSVDGKYDFIIKDLFTVNYNLKEAIIYYSILDKNWDFDLYKAFIEVFKDEIDEDLKKIELIEALLFFSMIPLHTESFEHQIVMLGTGIEILDRVIDIREN